MFAGNLELIAIILTLGSVWHCARYEGRAFAAQWFLPAFLYAVLREMVASALLLTYTYSPDFRFAGAVPLFVCLLWGSVYYLAYQFARRFTASEKYLPVAARLFLIAASFALPIVALATQLNWWAYSAPTLTLFGSMPLLAPVAWGVGAAIFYFAFWRVRRTPLPDRGKLYGMITIAPIIALVDVVVAFMLGV